MKEHHKVEVVRIEQVLPHGNAERLEIIPIQGYQAIAAKGQFKVGDLAYYIPPDSVVPEREEFAFLWANATYEGGVPLRKRRIAAKKLRGEWSEGLLMPCVLSALNVSLSPLPSVINGDRTLVVQEGNDVAEFLGITHYDPDEAAGPTAGSGTAKRRFPRTFRGWIGLIKSWLLGERFEGGPTGVPDYDVEAFKKHTSVFVPGEFVVVTEKIHGSNARFTFRTGLFGVGKFYVGSHYRWKAPGTCVFRKAAACNPWIELWCRHHPNYVLYGEVVPTQKKYRYGTQGEEVLFFLFDIRRPDGTWAEFEEAQTLLNHFPNGPLYVDAAVPTLYVGRFDEALIKQFVDGKTTVNGANHIREGIVIKATPERTVRGLGRAQLKIVSNDFLAKDSAEDKAKEAS